jgi:hypothetical protein
MENKENVAIKNIGHTCCNCLKEGEVNHIHIGALGWGSSFDNFSTQIDLCDECLEKTNPEWWKLKVCGNHDENGSYDEYGEWYEYEKEIFKYIKQMPLAGQELFYNHYGYGACADSNMDSQDWIDYELGTLSHEKCKEYGCYSPQEIKAYEDRFPNCKNVEIKVYSDGSKGSKCYMGAWGDENGNCECNISSKCYLCDRYGERTGEIKVVDTVKEYYENETARLNDMIAYATKRLEMIKNKTLKVEY